MLALRLPLSVGWGGLLSVVIFWALWQLISAPIDIGDRVEATRIDFTHLRVDTAPQTKAVEKPKRELPPMTPEVRGVTFTGPTLTDPVTYTDPGVEIVGPGRGLTGGSDQDVTPIVRIKPEYPIVALRKGTEGWVRVQFSVTATGSVRDPVVVAAEPANVFDRATLEAIRRWRYSPKIKDGVAVERVGLQTVIRFDLN